MARTRSAKKANRAALKKRVHNLRRKKELKDSLKRISAFVSKKDGAKAAAMFGEFQQAVDKASKGGVIKANTASRLKARIAKSIRALTS